MHMRYDEFLVRSVLDPFRFFPLIRCPSPKVLRTLREANLLRKYFTSYLDISRLPTRGCTWYECTTYPSFICWVWLVSSLDLHGKKM